MDSANSEHNAKAGVVASRFMLQAEDEHQILIDRWQAASGTSPRAVIQVLHGLGEHAARYERFAQACVGEGFVVVAHNHRGHGESCPSEVLGHYADKDGWNKVVNDVLLVRQNLLHQYAGVPLIVLGHSMGSYIAQCSIMRDPQGISMLILSATTCTSRLQLKLGRMLARFEILRNGANEKSELLNKMSFGDFNNQFAPNRTEFDWLSRDVDEVDKYVADPACGAMSSNRLWYDLLGGLLEITSARALRSVPLELPILIMGGQLDPVGGQAGLSSLARRYRRTGHTGLTLSIYAGGRHEMLNETNRDVVTNDIIDWIHMHLRGGCAG